MFLLYMKSFFFVCYRCVTFIGRSNVNNLNDRYVKVNLLPLSAPVRGSCAESRL